jgi:hypothetical protein
MIKSDATVTGKFPVPEYNIAFEKIVRLLATVRSYNKLAVEFEEVEVLLILRFQKLTVDFISIDGVLTGFVSMITFPPVTEKLPGSQFRNIPLPSAPVPLFLSLMMISPPLMRKEEFGSGIEKMGYELISPTSVSLPRTITVPPVCR